LGQSAPEKRKQARLWPYVLVLTLLILAIVGYQVWQRSRWNHYIAALKEQPGIVVTEVERNWSKYTITGLRDPDSVDPLTILRSRGLDPAKAKFEWQTYLSLNTPFEKQRELKAAIEEVQGRIIRFDSGSSKLTSSEADRIDDITASVRRLFTMRPETTITITGRADETGSPETNDQLGMDRANRVGDALMALGIAESAISIMSVGNRKPLRQGSTDWDRAVNRSVSFSVNTAGRQ
jgi:outer membrane protein OmpA-like peptidoglycan-associated protein